MSTKYVKFTDQDLVWRACQGELSACSRLITQYLPFIRRRATFYFLPGIEVEDMIQEGLLGLLKAIRLYDRTQGIFGAFVILCVSSAMSTMVKATLSSRQRPLLNYTSLEEALNLKDSSLGPEDRLIAAEQVAEWRGKIASCLSPFEQNVLKLYIYGHSYTEISKLLLSSYKAVDNALQRVRRKLRSA